MCIRDSNYGAVPRVTHYLLSHFHYDHYVGLSRTWDGPILCSSVTKRLAVSRFRLPERLFTTMDAGEEALVAGVHLTALNAKHCPGSLRFDRVYLDTTYCTPQYDLPTQGDVVDRGEEEGGAGLPAPGRPGQGAGQGRNFILKSSLTLWVDSLN